MSPTPNMKCAQCGKTLKDDVFKLNIGDVCRSCMLAIAQHMLKKQPKEKQT